MSGAPIGATVLLIGKDARTDAIASALARSPKAIRLVTISEFRAPGLVRKSETFYGDVSLTDVDAIVEIAKAEKPVLVVIGPEEPLAAGVVDRLEDELSIPCFGPRGELAKIEASKTWCRELVAKHGIAGNPRFEACRSEDELLAWTQELGDFVIKPDGLTGGKGVKLSTQHFDSTNEALDYARDLLQADGVVLIEELLEGEEFSLQSITDGTTVVHTPVVQDHKRAFDGDQGPNTGGMGSYSCADFSLPFLTPDDLAAAREINEQVARAIETETGQPYRGVLYGGFIATRDGVRLIEYNARFGDPEAMNVLPLLQTDLYEACWNVAHGELAPSDLSFAARASVCKYVVPRGYPTDNKHAGEEIVAPALSGDDAEIYWAAVRLEGDKVLLTGSRALGCVGFGDTLAEANAAASAVVDHVSGNIHSRTDIGSDALIQKRIDHMAQLRS